MDRELLKRYLDDGLSLPQIGKLEGRDPSTVGYWVKKHGLVANGKDKYAPRGGCDKAGLERLVAEGLTLHEMADRLGRSSSTVRHWLQKHGLKTSRARGRRVAALAALQAGERSFEWECSKHGQTTFHVWAPGRSRCARCSSDAVTKRRRTVKDVLVEEGGGECRICGYKKCVAALQFHHADPTTKRFSISGGGWTRAINELRQEAKKCVLLCATCHAEVEAGVTECPTLEMP